MSLRRGLLPSLLPLLTAGSCAGSMRSPATASAPALDASLEPLRFFVGRWEGQSTMASGRTVALRWTVTPALRGHWIAGEAQIVDADTEARDYWAPVTGGFVRVYLDNDRTHGVLRSTGWREKTWVWEGEAHAVDGTAVQLRETIERLDDHTMHARWEVASDGAWAELSQETLRRRQ